MRIAEIRAAAVAILDGLGFSAVSSRPIEKAPTSFPYAYFGDARTTNVENAPVELWTWAIPLTVLVGRKANSADELALAETAIAGIMARIRENQTLGGLTMGVRVTAVREGVVRYGGEEFYGVTLDLVTKERIAATYRA